MKIQPKLKINNNGSGLGVILFGITLLLVLLFTAVNIVNSKVVENGYTALRDAVQSASSGSVIHLLTSVNENTTTQAQQASINPNPESSPPLYDIYLQLALGYIINREATSEDRRVVQSDEINNFIKLDHQKVVNNTLALLENAARIGNDISETEDYKIMMFFIEPYYHEDTGHKYFDIFAYGNDAYTFDASLGGKNIGGLLAKGVVDSSDYTDMTAVYNGIQTNINNIVNCENVDTNPRLAKYVTSTKFSINLNPNDIDVKDLISDMGTYPHYLIVVKDFALPTLFNRNTNNEGSGIKSLFGKDTTLKSPMCALNTGKIQRQHEEAGWGKDLKNGRS